MGKTVIAAMSGGVDSSAAAALLKEQGFNVIGITLNVWPREGVACAKTCCSITDVDDARMVCSKLDIPHYVLNMRDLFQEKVIDYFVGEYMKGRTPNPCIACNAYVKFEALLDRAEALGADYIATGHYANITQDAGTREYILRRSADSRKDQTYVLYMLTQEKLSKILLPCGGYTKPDIRKVAEKYGLPTFKKADSQDLCFIGEEGYAGFLRENCSALARPGNVVTKDGQILGRHDGVYNFTIGQHKGLSKYTNSSEKLFVTKINAATGDVTIGGSEALFSDRMIVEEFNLILKDRLSDGCHVNVKIRYSAPEAGAVVTMLGGGRLFVVFDTPQRAITPGQAAVFYQDDMVIGGGIIEKASVFD
jgi:tRNA-specific 2-thiouridylase